MRCPYERGTVVAKARGARRSAANAKVRAGILADRRPRAVPFRWLTLMRRFLPAAAVAAAAEEARVHPDDNQAMRYLMAPISEPRRRPMRGQLEAPLTLFLHLIIIGRGEIYAPLPLLRGCCQVSLPSLQPCHPSSPSPKPRDGSLCIPLTAWIVDMHWGSARTYIYSITQITSAEASNHSL